jgi:predicted nucleic acid-binding protein
MATFRKGGRMPSTAAEAAQGVKRSPFLFDAGVFIAALLAGDPRHREARPLVEQARRGELAVCTTPGILSEVYGALTWEGAQPRHAPAVAAQAVRLLIAPPSAIRVLPEDKITSLRALELAARYQLTGRRVHDARHAAAALVASVYEIFTYDLEDWQVFEPEGLRIVGPPSTVNRLQKK